MLPATSAAYTAGLYNTAPNRTSRRARSACFSVCRRHLSRQGTALNRSYLGLLAQTSWRRSSTTCCRGSGSCCWRRRCCPAAASTPRCIPHGTPGGTPCWGLSPPPSPWRSPGAAPSRCCGHTPRCCQGTQFTGGARRRTACCCRTYAHMHTPSGLVELSRPEANHGAAGPQQMCVRRIPRRTSVLLTLRDVRQGCSRLAVDTVTV